MTILNEFASLADRRTLPPSLAKGMKAWRRGAIPMPGSYIVFHQGIAAEILAELVATWGIRVHNMDTRPSGWMDGMHETHVVVEDRRGGVHHLVYHDGNQGFMVRFPAGGAGSFRPDRLFTGVA